jgi:hypothetical protein
VDTRVKPAQDDLRSKASAFKPASTIARSSAGRFITVAQTKRLGSKALVGAPSRLRAVYGRRMP